MKNFAIALLVVIVFVLAIFVPSLVDNVFEKNTSVAKTPVGQERKQAEGEQVATEKVDSFTVGKAFGEEKGRFGNVDARVGRGKNYLLTQVNNRLKQLEPFRTRVNNMTTLGASERNSLVAELNAEIDMFEAFKPEINKSATKQDIRNVADKIKAEWIKSRLSVQRAEEQIVATKENQLIADADTASLGIQKRIDMLKASGQDTNAHEKLLSAFGEKIASARHDVESAKDKFDDAASASTEVEKERLMRGKELLLTSARGNIKDAYKMVGDEARREFSQRFK